MDAMGRRGALSCVGAMGADQIFSLKNARDEFSVGRRTVCTTTYLTAAVEAVDESGDEARAHDDDENAPVPTRTRATLVSQASRRCAAPHGDASLHKRMSVEGAEKRAGQAAGPRKRGRALDRACGVLGCQSRCMSAGATLSASATDGKASSTRV
eukprot:363275-Chlamydomonas_euryale.AAC.7